MRDLCAAHSGIVERLEAQRRDMVQIRRRLESVEARLWALVLLGVTTLAGVAASVILQVAR